MIEIKVIYQDAEYLVVSKPADLLVHRTGIAKSEETLADWLVKEYPEIKGVGDDPITRPGIVHRLDRDTSGVMVVARNQKAFDYLKKLFQNHEIKKTYLTLVWGKVAPSAGVIDQPIGLTPGTVKRTTWIKKAKLVKAALTRYRAVKFLNFQDQIFTLLEVEPKTGRTHQLRVHLNAIGHPVVGDRIYGKSNLKSQISKVLGLERQFLHAESVEFTAPGGGRIKVSADLPADLEQALSLLSPVRADHR